MTNPAGRRLVGFVAIVAVSAAVAWGLVESGTPAEERQRRRDERRIDDLGEIGRAVDLHWTRSGSLPATLGLLSEGTVVDATLRDPESGEVYEYRVLTDSTFELCASFETDWSPSSADVFWSHPKGRHCFDSEVLEVQREEAEQRRLLVRP